MDRRPALTWPTPLSLGIAAAVAVLAAGCGSAADGGSVTPQDAPSTPATDLRIEVTDGKTSTWTLTCDPVGGDHPEAEAACAALAAHGEQAVPATSADSLCTQIFGGEQTAKITGTWRGEAVRAEFSRADGCEVSRWDSLAPLLPKIAEPSQ